MSCNYPAEKSLDSPDKIAKMLCDVFYLHQKTEEYVYMIAMDTKYHLLGVFEVTHGTVNVSLISPREIFMKALLCNAAYIIIAHNHPSTDISPSTEDISATKRIKEVGKLLNIPMLDSIVIGDYDRYYSFEEEYLL